MSGDRAREADTRWFILRTGGKSTLVLTATLAADGYDVWTPILTQTVRIPRMNVRREVKLPLLPSFVFARGPHLVDLLELAKMKVKPRSGRSGEQNAHRDFKVFRFQDRIPFINDVDLEPLRQKEFEAIPRKALPRFRDGTKVRVTKGAFEGLHGRVERSKSGYALVIFTDWNLPVQIPTFLLSEDTSFS